MFIRRSVVFGMALSLGLAGGAIAQTPPPATPPPVQATAPVAVRLALAKELVIAINVEANARRLAEITVSGFPKAFSEFADEKQVAAVFERVLREEMALFADRTVPLVAQVYADTFDEQELRALLTFYRSPAGRKLMEKQQEIDSRSAAAVGPVLLATERDVISRVSKRLCEAKNCTPEEQHGVAGAEMVLLQILDAQSAALARGIT